MAIATTGPTGPLEPRDDEPSPWREDAWVDEIAAERSLAEHRRWMLTAMALLAVITFGDLLLIKTTLDHVLRDRPIISWAVGLTMAVAALSLAFAAGVESRRLEARRRPRSTERAQIAVLVLLWLAMGAGLTWLRWRAADLSVVPVVAKVALPTASDHEATRERLMAAVLATVYLASGALAWLDGQRMTNPVAAALRSVERRIVKLNVPSSAAEGRYARLVEHVALAEDELANIDAARDQALAANRALAEQLKRWARVQIAVHCGDPADTGLVRHEPTPQLPAAGLTASPPGTGRPEDIDDRRGTGARPDAAEPDADAAGGPRGPDDADDGARGDGTWGER